MPTHADITDRLREIAEGIDAFIASAEKERESIKELCGGLGHKWGATLVGVTSTGGGVFAIQNYRFCEVCNHSEVV